MSAIKYLVVLLAFFAFSCQSRKIKNKNDHQGLKVTSETLEEKAAKDTTSFAYFMTLTEENKELPNYLVTTFIDSRWIDSTDSYRYYYGDGTPGFQLGRALVLSYEITVYGVCGIHILTTYTLMGNVIESLQVGEHCDRDYGNPSYDYSNYAIFSDSIVEVTKEEERPKDIEAFYADTTDFHEGIEMISKTTYAHYIIKGDGTFKQFYDMNTYEPNEKPCIASSHILKSSELSKFSKEKLRYLRNEIFARKGYVFKDSTLLWHFKKFDWYHPQYDEISKSKLTPVEIYNIRMLQKAEAERGKR